ncbi:MAG TPA: dihydrolipoamide acetyltransferase family protein [Solirubrobacterales bacterium]|nr:dihydrolipoamide acetyltransferase family protein [Solirubrobacterales bacterium]
MSSSPTDVREVARTIAIAMPQMGISVAEGTIVEWRKQPGDWVEADEPVCDVSTDKVDVEIPSPAAGRLARILVGPGETVAVGTPLAELDADARPGEAHPEESGDADRSRVYSPIVRRMAAEHHVDLERVEGHGIGGRIRKADLLAFLDEKKEPRLHTESPYRPPSAFDPAMRAETQTLRERGVESDDLVGPTHREPMSSMRKQIAAHMVASRRTAAHCTTVAEVDFGRVAARRAELRPGMAARGVNLTYLAFVARATVAALQRHPLLNASVAGEEIFHHEDVNLGIAVALDDGLIVPVIRQAQRLGLEGMAAAIGDLATRAREKRLHPDEVQGGTFTITNPGQFGAMLATPIINQPQVAILDLEAVVKRPVVIERDGEDSIAVRPMSYLCMSWDHRALDGAEAARFLGDLRTGLEQGGDAS